MRHKRLETDELPAHATTVVVGSGFGGSVVAARIAAAGAPGATLILERGREWLPGEFPDSAPHVARNVRSRRNPMGLFDLTIGKDVDRLVACGAGGGSLIYANVLLEPRPEVFDVWPAGIDAISLTPYVQRVRAMLQPERVHELPGHAEPLRALASERGSRVEAVPVAVSLTRPAGVNIHGEYQAPCTGCGNCVLGCNVGAKTSMRASYLPQAVANGARLVTRTEVRSVSASPTPGSRWRVTGWRWEHLGSRYVRRDFHLDCDVVVLAAGALGSTAILLRSRDRGLQLSDAVGTRFSGNADSLALSYNSAPDRQSGIGAERQDEPRPPVGPTITHMVDARRGAHGHLVQDAVVPWPVAQLLRRILGARFALTRDDRVYCDLRPGGCPPGCSAFEHSQLWLAMGTDDAAGTVRLDRRGEPTIAWSNSHRQPVYAGQRADFALLSARNGSTLVTNPRHAMTSGGLPAQAPVTVHPLGGLPMGASSVAGAVDPDGRVFAATGTVHDGLYVADGSICPTSLGSNPALTIAALAERTAGRILLHEWAGVGATAPRASAGQGRSATVGSRDGAAL